MERKENIMIANEEKKGSKKILIIAATHGNEKIGVQIIKKLQIKGLDKYFDYLIANPKALQEKKEFIDANLNRVYPGKKNSRFYEERIAYKNIRIAKRYRYIIDIHEASRGKDDFIIVPREKVSRLFPVEFIDLKRIILWPDPKGPISQVLENAIELEFGMKQRKRTEAIEKAEKILGSFITKVESGKSRESTRPKQEIYFVYGKLMKKDFQGKIQNLRDFQKTEIKEEIFYPLLTGQYLKESIVCYKMRKYKNRH